MEIAIRGSHFSDAVGKLQVSGVVRVLEAIIIF